MNEPPLRAKAASSPPDRLGAVDVTRAALMALGLVLHGAAPFMVNAPPVWPIRDAARSGLWDVLGFAIHLFRMPAFFALAGFFGALLAHRLGANGMLRHRARRIGLPLLVFWPLVGAVTVFIIGLQRADVPLAALAAYTLSLRWLPRLGPGHLWFLVDLCWFFAAAWGCCRLGARWPAASRAAGQVGAFFSGRRSALPVLIAATALIGLGLATPAIDTSARFFPDPLVLASYALFFGWGWALFRPDGPPQRPPLGPRTCLLLLVPALLVYLALLRPWLEAGRPTGLARLPLGLAYGGVVWLLVWALVGATFRSKWRPGRWARWLADASYWSYLVHIPIVFALALLLREWPASGWLKGVVVIGGTAGLCLGTYAVGVRRTWIGWLLQGRRGPAD